MAGSDPARRDRRREWLDLPWREADRRISEEELDAFYTERQRRNW